MPPTVLVFFLLDAPKERLGPTVGRLAPGLLASVGDRGDRVLEVPGLLGLRIRDGGEYVGSTIED